MAERRETFEHVLAPEPGRTALVVVDMQRGFLDPGEASAETVPTLAPRQGEIVVRKRGDDAFAGSELDTTLRALNVTSLVVTGTMTDICVLATALHTASRWWRTAWPRRGPRSSAPR